MTLVIAQWPFLPEEQRTLEQTDRWWAECYVSSPAEVTLSGIAHSIIVYGGPGSGKTVSLRALEKMETERSLTIPYPVIRWPGRAQAWVGRGNHLSQIMVCASMALKQILTHQPDKLRRLSKVNLEYLRWLIEKYSSKRAFRSWADAMNHQPLLKLLNHPFDDLYSTDSEPLDVQGQIEELVTLSRRLGFDGVTVLVDINGTEIIDELLVEATKDLFGWLTPLQFEDFAIKAALPQELVEKADLLSQSRGRISFAKLLWSVELCHDLANRYLRAATDQQVTSLNQIVSDDELLATLEHRIEPLFGGPSPQGWVWLTHILLEQWARKGRQLTTPNYEELVHAYFANYVPLKFSRARRGIWRGVEFISLDDQPFGFLEILWQYRNSEYQANEALLDIAVNRGNLNTIASRLRNKIEPVPSQPVYVHNTRSRGYWLENVIESREIE